MCMSVSTLYARLCKKMGSCIDGKKSVNQDVTCSRVIGFRDGSSFSRDFLFGLFPYRMENLDATLQYLQGHSTLLTESPSCEMSDSP